LILQYVKKYGQITNRQVRELLGVDKFKASRMLRKLVKDKNLKREGYYAGDYRYVLH
jgi:predicted HTH transcriptional regulator